MCSNCILKVLTTNASNGKSTRPLSPPSHPIEQRWKDIDGSVLEFVSFSCKRPEWATKHCGWAACHVLPCTNCHVEIYVVAPILRTTIARKELTVMRSSIIMIIFVNIKMKKLMEMQMTPVRVWKTYYFKLMK